MIGYILNQHMADIVSMVHIFLSWISQSNYLASLIIISTSLSIIPLGR